MIQSTAVFPEARVRPNHWHAFGGVWRLTVRKFTRPEQGAVFLCIFALLALIEFATVRDARARTFSEWTIRFYLTFMVPMAGFMSGATALREEMKSGSADYVLTRPVRRPALVVFKFFSHLACVQFLGLIALAVVVSIARVRHIPGVMEILPSLALMQIMTGTAFTALGFFCGVLTARFLVLGLAYGAVVEVGLGRIPTQISRLSITHQVQDFLQSIMPSAPPLAPGVVPPTAAAVTVTLLVFTAVFLGLAAAIFDRREMIGEGARDT